MFLFGGSNSAIENKNLYTLDFKQYKWEIFNTRGDVPFSRDEHSAVIYESSMVIFGGFVKGERVNEVYKYYFKENRWEKVRPIGSKQPAPRAGHSCILSDEKMIIFGGKD